LSDFFKTAVTALVTAVIATSGTIYVSTFDYFNKSRELDLKMVDVSLAILRGDKGDSEKEQSIIAREFALRALRKYSNVELKDNDLNEWVKTGGALQFNSLYIAAKGAFGGRSTGYVVVDGKDIWGEALSSEKWAVKDNVSECKSEFGVYINNKFSRCVPEEKPGN